MCGLAARCRDRSSWADPPRLSLQVPILGVGSRSCRSDGHAPCETHAPASSAYPHSRGTTSGRSPAPPSPHPDRPPATYKRRAPGRPPEETAALLDKAVQGHHNLLVRLNDAMIGAGWGSIVEIPAAIDLEARTRRHQRVVFEAKTLTFRQYLWTGSRRPSSVARVPIPLLRAERRPLSGGKQEHSRQSCPTSARCRHRLSGSMARTGSFRQTFECSPGGARCRFVELALLPGWSTKSSLRRTPCTQQRLSDPAAWTRYLPSMPTIPAPRLLRVSTAKRQLIQDWREGISLETDTGRTIDELRQRVVADRLQLAYDFRRRGNALMTLSPPLYRDAVSRFYYAMYHGMRAVVYFVEGETITRSTESCRSRRRGTFHRQHRGRMS